MRKELKSMGAFRPRIRRVAEQLISILIQLKRVRVVCVLGILLLAGYSNVYALKPFSGTHSDPWSDFMILLFLTCCLVLLFAPVVCLIIGFVSRKARPAWFIVPFTITALFGLFHIITGVIDALASDTIAGSFYWGAVYLGIALVSLVSYLRRRRSAD